MAHSGHWPSLETKITKEQSKKQYKTIQQEKSH